MFPRVVPAVAPTYAPFAMAKPESSDEPVSDSEEPDGSAAKRETGESLEESGEAEREEIPLPGTGTREGSLLREAVRAFEVGDYARTRARVRELANASDPDVRVAAMNLRTRISVDPVQIVVVATGAAVLATIAYLWII